MVYLRADKPLDYIYAWEELIESDKELNIPLNEEKKSQKVTPANSEPADFEEIDEPEEIILSSFVNKDIPAAENEPEKPELGLEYFELVKELEDELSKVEPPKKEPVPAFFSDMED
ncbi:hypothetical protein J7E38_13375 [Bacillus sp. ISL-35]|uniref:hypothetical protein n=1 Tax=Bacillus sp. ISL-35 TaxID=2819122 RepID=UPI001BE97DFD|nr:hypothetical protein [Bacillus sp. ISL-35]MBT2679999.1 hypothetical protein [Bacillus sp. ISL-35]MBT2703025.1 hypothetical protein [Chryseobacterium sp. ISL-80]